MTPASGSPSSFTIGRTRRGWIWAALAVAAALLIMVLQAEPERDDLARVDNRIAKSESGATRSRELELRSLDEESEQVAASEPADPAPAPSNDESRIAPLDRTVAQYGQETRLSDQLAMDRTPSRMRREMDAPLGQSTAEVAEPTRDVQYYSDTVPGAGPATDSLAERGTETLSAGYSATTPTAEMNQPADEVRSGLAYRDSPPRADAKQAGSQLVVVRVLAKQAALEAKTFDRLLQRNGIEVEPPTNEAMSEERLPANVRSRRFAMEDESEAVRQKLAAPQSGDEPNVEAVLVEAPEQMILSCLDGLNKDSENYLGVKVEDASLSAQPSPAGLAVEAPSAPQAAAPSDRPWTRYNRGYVPADKDFVVDNRYSYGEDQSSFGGGQLGRGAEGVEELEQLKETEFSLARQNLSEAKNAKAVRLHTWGIEPADRVERLSRAPDSSVASGSAPGLTKFGDVERRLRTSATVAGDNMQVLFLLQPDKSAGPSPAAKARAQ